MSIEKKAKPLWKLQYGEQPPPVPSKTKYVELSDAQAEIDIHERALTLQGLLLTKMEKEVKELKELFVKEIHTLSVKYCLPLSVEEIDQKLKLKQ